MIEERKENADNMWINGTFDLGMEEINGMQMVGFYLKPQI